ncbi:hypothetical protein [Streptomyces sp. NPDC048473]
MSALVDVKGGVGTPLSQLLPAETVEPPGLKPLPLSLRSKELSFHRFLPS